ncbi:MAG: 30S ribosome-binding factor RbfA [Bacteroidetes bacterium]|nr:30S ribosome-binding factor RbfA [Bacteroidota bacterium]
MESMRQQKINRMIQKELGIAFLREGRGLFGGAMITVTKVTVTKDLALAKIYLSLFGTKDKAALMALIRHHGRDLRFHMAQGLRNQLRIIPELQFFEDDSLDYIDKIDNLLKT